MNGGSQQLRRYRIARRDGATTEQAAELAGIGIAEARLHDADDAKNPPGPECFELMTETPAGVAEAHPGSQAGTTSTGGHHPAPMGHNSKEADMAEADPQVEDKGSIAAQELRLFVERVERLEEEKKGIADDIKDVMSEMKGRGYNTAVVRKLISIRKRKKGEFEEEMTVLETYASALGMQLSLI